MSEKYPFMPRRGGLNIALTYHVNWNGSEVAINVSKMGGGCNRAAMSYSMGYTIGLRLFSEKQLSPEVGYDTKITSTLNWIVKGIEDSINLLESKERGQLSVTMRDEKGRTHKVLQDDGRRFVDKEE